MKSKIALLIALIGIASLLVLAVKSDPPLKKINQISEKEYNQKVAIEGRVYSVKSYDARTLLKIQDETGFIETVFFEKNPGIKKGDRIKIEGRITSYNRKIQISIEKIEKI